MFDHPIIRNIFLFLGSYFALNFLGILGPWLPGLVVVAAGISAAIIWLYHADYPRLQALHGQPWAAPVIRIVCERLLNTQAPIGPKGDAHQDYRGSDAERSNQKPRGNKSSSKDQAPEQEEDHDGLLLHTKEEFDLAKADLKEVMLGSDDAVDTLMRFALTNVQVRAMSDSKSNQPPLGMFLLVGPEGLGKRHMFVNFAKRMHEAPSYTVIDLGDSTDPRQEMIDAVKRRPSQSILLERIENADNDLLRDLDFIAAGQPLRDRKGQVSFRQVFLFLSSDRSQEASERLRKLRGATFGATSLIQAISEETQFDTQLTSMIDEILFFRLPSAEVQAAVVLKIMEAESSKFGMRLDHVDADVIIGEIKAIQRIGSFQLTQGRVVRRLKRLIAEAKEEGRDSITVESLIPTSSHLHEDSESGCSA